MKADAIHITEVDYLRLKNLIETIEDEGAVSQLDLELEVATIIDASKAPADLVTMNSKLRFLDLTEQKENTIEIVYPHAANLQLGKISILAPLATALIGLRSGEQINWQFPNGKVKCLRVLEVLYQPEAQGQWHL